MDNFIDDNTKKIIDKYWDKFGEIPYYPSFCPIDWDKVAEKAQKAIDTNTSLTDEEKESFEKECPPDTVY